MAPVDHAEKPYTLSIGIKPVITETGVQPGSVGETERVAPKTIIPRGSTLYIKLHPHKGEIYEADEVVCRRYDDRLEAQPAGYSLTFQIDIYKTIDSSILFRTFNKAMQRMRDKILDPSNKKFGKADLLFDLYVKSITKYDFETYRGVYEQKINEDLMKINQYMITKIRLKGIKVNPGSYSNGDSSANIDSNIFRAIEAERDMDFDPDPDMTGRNIDRPESGLLEAVMHSEDESP